MGNPFINMQQIFDEIFDTISASSNKCYAYTIFSSVCITQKFRHVQSIIEINDFISPYIYKI